MVLSVRAAVVLLAGVVAVVLRPQWSTAYAWIGLVAVACAVDAWLAGSPRWIGLDRAPVDRVRLGESTTAGLTVENTGRRRLRLLVRDAWQPSAGATGERHRITVKPGGRSRVRTTLTPTRRGDRRADRVTVRTRGPLGLAGRQRSVDLPGSVRCLPPFTSRKHLPSRLARLRELDGRAAIRVRGQGTEFDSLRDYVRGDDVRSIDWRATARRRNVVVRTWQPERDRVVVLVLDTSRTSAARVLDIPRLDASMDAGLLLGALAERAGDRVHLIAGDRQVRARHKTGSSGGAVAGLVEAMTNLEPVLGEADWSTLVSAINEVSRQRALVVICSSLDPAAIEEGLLPVLPALAQRHRVVLASVQDPALADVRLVREDITSTYAAAAAEQVVGRREHVTGVLGRLGVTVVDATPEQLPVALTDHYLMLKAHALL